jgi:hypothetical protein
MKAAVQVVDHPILELEYRAELTLRLQHELRRGHLTFKDLVGSAEGAYPSDVLFVLSTLQTAGESGLVASRLLADARNAEQTEEASGCRSQQLTENSDDLPEPHPLDFDWRFSQNALLNLQKEIRATPDDRIAVLGAPTLFMKLVDSGLNTHLFDKNPHVIQHLKSSGYASLTQCDLFKYSGHSAQFEWAIADPPWYLEHYRTFLAVSRNLLVPEGRLFLSVLPRLTRPSAASDRLQIITDASDLGFDLIEIKPAALHYLSPAFEMEALRAEGLMLDNWRSGDLFSFILRSRTIRESTTSLTMSDEDWDTIQLGKTTIRIKQEQPLVAASFDYQPASPSGDIRLRSVSRRSPVRSRINVWSSRNIALQVSKSVVLAESLHKIGHGESPGPALASVAYQYQLNTKGTSKLQQILKLLMRDAGLTWNE